MREPSHPTADEVRGTLARMRALEPPLRDGTAAAQRRLRMTRAMRAEMDGARDTAAAGGVRSSWLRRLGWGALVVGTATAAVVLVVDRAGSRRADPGVAANVRVPAPLVAAVGVAVIDGALTVENAGAVRRLATGEQRSVSERDVLETSPIESAQLRVGDVGRVVLAPASRVVAVGTTPGSQGGAGAGTVDRLTLVTGRAHLSIAKLGTGRTFRVVTAAATVQVHGTEFDVEIAAGATPRTCVRVQEGLVEVIAGAERTFLKPGHSWGCDGAGAVPVPTGLATEPHTGPSASLSPARGGGNQTNSELRTQNVLFEKALRAERAGRAAQAGDLYRRLLERYPQGPLAPQAKSHLSTLPHRDR